MKLSQYKVYDDGTATGAEAAIFVDGALAVGGTADASINWVNIPARDIVKVHFKADVPADVAWTQTWTPASMSADDTYTLTIVSADSRQRQRKVFKYTAVTGDTATTVCDAFRSLVNASSLPITATGTTTLILTADTEGTGINYMVTGGSVGGTFTGGSATADAQRTTAAYLEATHEGVDADDFGTLTASYGYHQYIVEYLVRVPSSIGQVVETRYAGIFIDGDDGGTILVALNDALNADWTLDAADAVSLVANSKSRYDMLS